MAAGKRIAVLALILAVCQVSTAVDHVVGGTEGWRTQPTVGYDQWAAGQTFRVGDTLTFNYVSNHDVLQLSEADYNSCNAAQPIRSYLLPSPIVVTLLEPGQHWFICGVPGHCDGGMRIPINVLEATTTPGPAGQSAPSPLPGNGAPPPLPGNGAATTILSAGVVAAAVAALF